MPTLPLAPPHELLRGNTSLLPPSRPHRLEHARCHVVAPQALGVDAWLRSTGNSRGDFVPNPGDLQLPAALSLGLQVTKNPVKQLAVCGQPRASLRRSTTVGTAPMDKFESLWAKIDELPVGVATRTVVDYLFEEEIGARCNLRRGFCGGAAREEVAHI